VLMLEQASPFPAGRQNGRVSKKVRLYGLSGHIQD